MQKNLLVHVPEQGVLLLTLNRPEALNALNTALLNELSAVLDTVEADAEFNVPAQVLFVMVRPR